MTIRTNINQRETQSFLHNRCRGSSRESGKSVTLDHVIAASEGWGDADGGEGLAVG